MHVVLKQRGFGNTKVQSDFGIRQPVIGEKSDLSKGNHISERFTDKIPWNPGIRFYKKGFPPSSYTRFLYWTLISSRTLLTGKIYGFWEFWFHGNYCIVLDEWQLNIR